MPSRRNAPGRGRSYIVPTLFLVSLLLTAGVAGGAPGKANENASGNCNGKAPKKQNCAPSVTLVAPAAGTTVLGFVDVRTEVNAAVVAVTVSIDGTTIAEDTETPFTARWDSTKVANGAHTVTATALNATGESARVASAVNVSNPVPDTISPSVGFTSPAAGSTISGSVNVAADASDNIGIAGVQFKLDGTALGSEDTTAPYAVTWSTTASPNGTHALTAVVRDVAGNTSAAQRSVTVSNAFADSTAPTVSFTSPASGATVSGQVSVAAGATDDVAVVGVQFTLDGAALGVEDTSPPYAVTWNTTTAPDGAHTLTAVARDAAGHRTAVHRSVSASNASTTGAARLTWAPPPLTSPITITVPSTNGKIYMDKTRDYIVKVGHLTACGGLWLEGGRNVVVVGGRVSIDSVCASAYDRTAVKVRYNTGVVHLEGLLLDGAYLHDGIVTAAPAATLQIQNVRVAGTRTLDSNHPDCVQAQAGIGALRIDRLSCYTALQGIFLGDHTGAVGPVAVKHTNIVGSPGDILFWKSDSRPTSPPVTVEDSWLHAPSPRWPTIGAWVYPNTNGDLVDMDPYGWTEGGTSRKAVVSPDGLYVSWIGTNISGGFRKGAPPGGDFVPASAVGATYVSPGYGA